MLRHLFSILGFVLLVSSVAHGGEGEWSRFRGPNGSGISNATTVPVRWTDKDYNWKVELPGIGHSSPVVWGKRVFVTCGDPRTAKRIVICLDTTDGRPLWQRDYPSRTYPQHGDNCYATATPAVDADGLVLTWTTPEQVLVLAVDLDGREVWRRDLGPFIGVQGSGSSPILFEDLVVLANDQEDPSLIPGRKTNPPAPIGKSFLVALDRKTGQTRWQIERSTSFSAYSTPCVYQTEGGRPNLIFSNTAHGITAVDPATGKVQWEFGKPFLDRAICSPVVAPGLVIAGHGAGLRGSRYMAVRPGVQGREPTLAYEITRSIPLVPTPLVKDGRLFLWTDDGVASCLRLVDGEVFWRERVGGSYFGSPVCVNNRLYCTSKGGEVVVVAASDKFEVLARVPLGEPSFGTPAVAGGVMYLRTRSHLFSLGGSGKAQTMGHSTSARPYCQGIVMCNLLAVLTFLLAQPPADTAASHPQVFVTPADVARVRQAVSANKTFAGWADELVQQAQAAKISDLPPLERTWWEKDRTKPWLETYPQVYHHTWIVPERWAALARRCAWAGLLRPETKLSDKARQTLLALSDFTFEFEHYDVGLNYTVWALQAMEAYDILYDSFTSAQRRKIDAFFERFLAAVEKNDEHWVRHEPGGALNNHYAWHKLGLVAMGVFYHRPELVDQALDGPKGIEFLVRHGFTDDGLWMEGSIPYQLAATTPLVKAAELLENAGHRRKLYGHESGDGRTLKGAYDALLPLVFPDRTLPTIGDCYGHRPHLGQRADWEILCRRFRDPRYAWLLRDMPRRSPEALFAGLAELPPAGPPPQFSRLWPEHGYAALRSVEGTDYWTGRGWSLFATYSRNRVHENFDKLSIILFADGHLWLPDCEALPSEEHSFSAKVQAELNRQTLCHNTLLVDGRSQRHPAGPLELVEYQSLPNVKRLTMGDLAGQLYPGVGQLRTCLVRDEYVLDFFQVSSAAPHDLDWLLHVDGRAEKRSAARPAQLISLPSQVPWKYLRSPERLDRSTTYWETFEHGGRRFRVDVVCSSPQEILGCGFPRDDRAVPETTAMRIFRSKQARAWYAALYRSGKNLEQPIQAKVMPGELNQWQITVELANRRYVHRVPRIAGATDY